MRAHTETPNIAATHALTTRLSVEYLEVYTWKLFLAKLRIASMLISMKREYQQHKL